MTLFNYPHEPHTRRHGPKGYASHSSYKPWLRDEFEFRCVYCLFRERWYPNGSDSFGVDHALPKSVRPDLECTYDNLLYACNRCNTAKGTAMVPNPCQLALRGHVRVNNAGLAEGNTPEGTLLIEVLGLNNPTTIEFRRRMLEVFASCDSPLLTSFFGYPDDLPDLSLARPTCNTRPKGITQSTYVRRSARQLSVVY